MSVRQYVVGVGLCLSFISYTADFISQKDQLLTTIDRVQQLIEQQVRKTYHINTATFDLQGVLSILSGEVLQAIKQEQDLSEAFNSQAFEHRLKQVIKDVEVASKKVIEKQATSPKLRNRYKPFALQLVFEKVIAPESNCDKKILRRLLYTFQQQFERNLAKAINKAITQEQKALNKLKMPSIANGILLSKMLARMFKEIYMQRYWHNVFYWCSCINDAKRILLILQVVADIKAKKPDRQKPLVYTTFASGSLLQDFLTLRELIYDGYKDLRINIIDIGYPDALALKELFVNIDAKQPYEDHFYQLWDVEQALDAGIELDPEMKKLKETATQERILATFRHRIRPAIPGYKVHVQAFKYVEDFLARAKKEQEKETEDTYFVSDVLLMADPDYRFLQVAQFPSRANILGIQINDVAREKPLFYIVMSEDKQLQVYEWYPFRLHPKVKKLRDLILKIADETTADQAFKPAFRNRLIEQLQTESKTNGYIDPKDYTLTWYSDAHLSFQKLVKEAGKDDSLIFILYFPDPVEYQRHVIMREQRAEYLKKDVFKPNLGRMLVEKKITRVTDSPVRGPRYGQIDVKSGEFIWVDAKRRPIIATKELTKSE